jgi:hypothetical protein
MTAGVVLAAIFGAEVFGSGPSRSRLAARRIAT